MNKRQRKKHDDAFKRTMRKLHETMKWCPPLMWYVYHDPLIKTPLITKEIK